MSDSLLETISRRSVEAFKSRSTHDHATGTRHFIPRSVELFKVLPEAASFHRITSRIDPQLFLSYQDETTDGTELRGIVPSVSVIVGTYGCGKTELVRQLGRRFLEAGVYPVCVALSRCREYLTLDGPADRRAFATALVKSFDPNPLDRTQVDFLIQSIVVGKVVLLLDALDELLHGSKRHYSWFLSSLASTLTVDGEKPLRCGFRVVVTSRSEFLSLVDTPEYKTIIKALKAVPGDPQLYLLSLRQFTEWESDEYFESRLECSKHLSDLLSAAPRLSSLLRRPLLLRIFCDLTKELVRRDRGRSAEDVVRRLAGLDRTEGIRDAGHLLDQYISLLDEEGKRLQSELSILHWDREALTEECVRLGHTFEQRLDVDALRRICQAADRSTAAETASDDEILNGVHKAPFFIADREQPGFIRFSHRAFFEFFLAEGMVRELERYRDDMPRADGFNKIVVNPDTRKFLRYFCEKLTGTSFDEWIKKSCGCGPEHAELWALPDGAFAERRDELGATLVSLTLGMTAPDEPNDRVERALASFLARQDLEDYYVGYLIYCFHAVATYIREHPRHTDFRKWNDALSVAVRRAFERSVQKIRESANPGELEQRMIVQAAVIAGLLRFDWWPQIEENLGNVRIDDWEHFQKQKMEAIRREHAEDDWLTD